MNARDELARDIFLADNTNAPAGLMEKEWDENPSNYSYAHGIAEGLIAKGYSKPRQVSTVEELDALPVNAVIRGKWLAEKWGSPEGDMWFIAGRNMEWFTDDIVMRGGLPATVLYEPEAAK